MTGTTMLASNITAASPEGLPLVTYEQQTGSLGSQKCALFLPSSSSSSSPKPSPTLAACGRDSQTHGLGSGDRQSVWGLQ